VKLGVSSRVRSIIPSCAYYKNNADRNHRRVRLKLEERKFSLEEAFAAREAFIMGRQHSLCRLCESMGSLSARVLRDRWQRNFALFFMIQPRAPITS